jgi:hypothetical protein
MKNFLLTNVLIMALFGCVSQVRPIQTQSPKLPEAPKTVPVVKKQFKYIPIIAKAEPINLFPKDMLEKYVPVPVPQKIHKSKTKKRKV